MYQASSIVLPEIVSKELPNPLDFRTLTYAPDILVAAARRHGVWQPRCGVSDFHLSKSKCHAFHIPTLVVPLSTTTSVPNNDHTDNNNNNNNNRMQRGAAVAALTFSARLGDDGRVLEHRVQPTLLRDVRRMNYKEASNIVEGVEQHWPYSDAERADLVLLDALATRRRQMRESRGAFDIRLPQSVYVFVGLVFICYFCFCFVCFMRRLRLRLLAQLL
jgi:hypothetical protein